METYDVIVAGAGPAGSSAAALLAEAGLRTLLLEEKRMPRDKVCGEFITPESFPTLERLGLMELLFKAGARDLTTATLFAENGRSLSIPISGLSGTRAALGLSRAALDQIMLSRARETGAECIEGAAVKKCTFEGNIATGVEAMLLPAGRPAQFKASLVIDATGRGSRIMVTRDERRGGPRGSRLYAVKAHLQGVSGVEDRVELYFFRHGYGGLSGIEGGLANLCFITSEDTLRHCAGDTAKVAELSIMRNPAARARLAGARPADKWLSVGPLTFGKRRISMNGVIAIGDAAGMIDPFTGTGIQIALRSGEILADSVISALSAGPGGKIQPEENEAHSKVSKALEGLQGKLPAGVFERVLSRYRDAYDAEFGQRMWVAQILRRAAFSAATGNVMGRALARAPGIGLRMMKATRRWNKANQA
ncbi:MAG TPA: FAD-dependent monooxygenase [Blastocatellia bacterium]